MFFFPIRHYIQLQSPCAKCKLYWVWLLVRQERFNDVIYAMQIYVMYNMYVTMQYIWNADKRELRELRQWNE